MSCKINKYWVFIVLLFTILAKAQDNQVDYVIFSGNIINGKQNVFKLKGLNDKVVRSIELDSNGYFIDSIKTEPQQFVFYEGLNKAYIELKPGDNLTLFADANNFLKTLKFNGSGANLNNYLVGIDNLYKEENINFQNKYSKDEKEFTAFKKEWKKKQLDYLSKNKSLPKEFVEIEERNLYYGYVRDFINYEHYHARFEKNKEYKISNHFLDEFLNLNWENEQDYMICHHYKHLINDRTKNNFYSQLKNEEDESLGLIEYINNNIKNQYIKDQLLFKHSEYNITYTNNLEKFYKTFSKGIKNPELKSKITDTYNKLISLSRGKISPKFINYKNFNGGKSSLDDFTGKYLYIDIWATWCPPCTNEIQYLQEIYKKYQNKNIAFINISVDKQSDFDEWRKMISEKDMKWIQLFSDNSWSSDFIKAYSIKGIPRYILLDPNGKILSSNAPRPSNPKLIDFFNELGI